MGCGASRETAEGGGVSKGSRQTCPSLFSSGGDLHVVRENVGPEESEHEEELQQGEKDWIVNLALWQALFKIYLPIEYLRWSLARGNRQSAGQAESSSDQGGSGDGILRSKAAKNEQPRL